MGQLHPAPAHHRPGPRRGEGDLTQVLDAYRKPEHQVRFSWRPGSIAFWDNRAAVHYAVRNYGDFPRLLDRILIADEPQYADL
ncbi:MAG: TauD/TfdA family dioxygenase [Caulobacteraceae bacterium]